MKNKKAWLRIVEAFIAVLIITSVLLMVITKTPKEDKSTEMHKMQRDILNQVAGNEKLRQEILVQGSIENTTVFAEQLIPSYLNFTLKICPSIDDICNMDIYLYVETDIYADEILISSTLQQYQPKKLKLFVWEK